ncbi:DNA recombination protein RmuC [Psychrosphaera aestuarii]|uniref:DNA recombination protein RmuC n=1 Tax=Psychrosphaera aestuarii TaxID=1266052 RepID=UPI001B32AC75|nr:DNA recombination protein RmuC [Psychrosphaera aestuarii]
MENFDLQFGQSDIVIGCLVIVLLILLRAVFRGKSEIQALSMQLQEVSLNSQQNLAKVAELEIAVKEQQERALNFQTQTQLSQQQVASLKSEVEGLQTRINERNQTISEQKEQSAQWQQQLHSKQQELMQLNSELTEIKTSLVEKQQHFEQQQAQVEQQRTQLKMEFANLANKILEEKSQSFSQSNKTELDAILRPFKEQVEGFQKRVNEVHSESIKGQATVSSELKKVLEVGMQMTSEANNLATALKGDKKTTGNWGEIQLERTLQLAGLMKDDHYNTQENLVDEEGNRRLPDFVIKLPDDKHIVIDSKVSLVAYDKAIAAETDAEMNSALDEHCNAIKNHINDLFKKDYSNLIGLRSPSFVLMFMPIEPAYIEALKHKKDLFNYGYEKNVILVSHTTLMPILKTVANLWRIEQGNAEAKEISLRAGDIYNQVCIVAERLQKLGKSLNTVSNQYNETVKGLAGKQGLAGKVERFNQLSNKVTKKMPQIEPNHSDFEHERLDLIAEPVSDKSKLNDVKGD